MSKPQDGFVSRFLNRPISRRITRFLVKFPIHPNAWSMSIFVLPLIACVFLVRGDYVSVYVPTTPNPTSGFFLMLPRADVVELDMSVDEALKYVISMGVVAPAKPAPRPLDEPR